MQVPTQSDKFTPLQLDMLRLFAREVPEEQLLEIRRMIARYFAEKLSDTMDASIDAQGISAEQWVEDLKHERLRTPYERHQGRSFKDLPK